MPAAFTHVVEFDEAELVCRMVEAYGRAERPAGRQPAELLAGMPDEFRDDWLRVAEAVHNYLNEMMMKAQRVQ